MNYESVECRRLATDEWHQIVRGEEMASGRQGSIFPVVQVDGQTVSDWLLKVYKDNDARTRAHAEKFAQYVEAHKADLRTGGLSGLPRDPVEMSDGRLAVFLFEVPGETLDSRRLFEEQLYNAGLEKRLGIASQIALLTRRLHDNRVVHADISHMNILLALPSGVVYLIDVDGGGVLAGTAGNEFEQDLSPVVSYQPSGGCIVPPECERGEQPTRHSDAWAMAVIVHQVLMPHGGGIDPFNYLARPDWKCIKSSDYYTAPTLAWPPDPGRYPTAAKAIEIHRRELGRLGDHLENLFKRTFQDRGRKQPDLRPDAKSWARELEKSSRWVFKCPDCGQDFVARRRAACPFCARHIRHAVLESDSKQIVVDDDKSVRGTDLGFPGIHEEIVRLARHGRRLEIIPPVSLQERRTKHREGAAFTVGPSSEPYQYRAKFAGTVVGLTLHLPEA